MAISEYTLGYLNQKFAETLSNDSLHEHPNMEQYCHGDVSMAYNTANGHYKQAFDYFH